MGRRKIHVGPTKLVPHGEGPSVRDDGRPESGGRDFGLSGQDVLFLLLGLQGNVRAEPREVRRVKAGSANLYPRSAVHADVASALWARLTWSKALLGLLVVNLVWTLSLFCAPFTVPPRSFANEVGGANVIDHETIWEKFPLYARAIYTIGDAQCHQLYYRSFWLNGNQMPIDERMTSMYVFANLGVLAAMFARPSTKTGEVMLDALPAFVRRRLSKLGTERAGAAIVVLGLIPMAIDGFTQLFRVNNYESTPLARVVTGALAGFVGGLLVAAMLVTIRQFSIEMQALQARYALAPAPER